MSGLADLLAAKSGLRMHARDGLEFDGVPLRALAETQGTPLYVHSLDTLRRRFGALRAAMGPIAIHYALKANATPAFLSALAADGAGADVVSGGELAAALEAGFPPERIVFSGVGKTARELAAALEAGIGQINVESPEELTELSAIAAHLGRAAPVALRVNPDIEAGAHDKIATGRRGDKFGIPHDMVADLYAGAARLPGIAMRGLAMHIGSQILSLGPYRAAYARLAALAAELRGRGLPIAALDCGGGLGIGYAGEPAPLPEAWAGAIRGALGDLGLDLAIEPGRWLAAPAGLLLTRVIRTRRAGMERPMLVLDAGMNDLLRPALYGAWHAILPLDPVALRAPAEPTDVVGPVCESSDVFARERSLPALEPGALVAILDAGAYGAVMASTYNARPLAPQMVIEAGAARPARAGQER